MIKNNCIFCKIINNEVPSVRIWEDSKHLAILDLNPNTEGMTLVLTKEHFDSDAIEMPDKQYSEIMIAAKKVAKLMKNKLNVKRVALVMEGLGINHVHIKLYPLYGIEKDFEEIWAKDKIYSDRYKGFISTQLGPEKSLDDLKKIQEKFI